MNHTQLEATFKKVSTIYENKNPCGVMSFKNTTFSEKPLLVNITSHYKDQGYGESELVGLQYRTITLSDLKKSFEMFLQNSWVPELCVFADEFVKNIMVDQNSKCICIQEHENVGFGVLSILSGSGSNWSLLDFYCLSD